MQTYGERRLISQLEDILDGESKNSLPHRILNIGAGKSVVIEQALVDAGLRFVCDRIDVVDCLAVHETVQRCWTGSVECMHQVEGDEYDAAFANYVLEHVENIGKAASEIHRILKPGGKFVASLTNTTAPEFQISKRTPHWFHQMVRGEEACETAYAYSGIKELAAIFQSAGFRTGDIKYYPAVGNYLSRFPILAALGRGYDRVIGHINKERLLGDVCLTLGKCTLAALR